MIINKTSKDLKSVLMKGVKAQLKHPYSIINDLEQAIFVVFAGMNGEEFNKTEGFVSNYPNMQIFQCLFGQGVLLMQRNDQTQEAKEFKVVSLREGRQVGIPAGWAMCLVNVGKTFLVVLGNLDVNSKFIDPKPILQKHGLAYYVVEKKGEISFEENPNYLNHPQITTE